MTHAMKTQKQHTAGWYGRSSGNSASIYCALNGWREAVWKRDPRGRWYEASATMRSVIGIDQIGNVTLGEPRKVRP